MRNLFFIALVISIGLISCKRANVKGDIKNRKEILTSRTWILVSKSYKGNIGEPLKDCQKDNYFVFEGNGQGRWEEGTNNCFENPDSTYTSFQWSISGDQLNLELKNFESPDRNPSWHITHMDYTTMEVTWADKINNELVVYNLKFDAR